MLRFVERFRLQAYLKTKDKRCRERHERLDHLATPQEEPRERWFYPLGTAAIGAAMLALIKSAAN